jgi:hypothetical protein
MVLAFVILRSNFVGIFLYKCSPPPWLVTIIIFFLCRRTIRGTPFALKPMPSRHEGEGRIMGAGLIVASAGN